MSTTNRQQILAILDQKRDNSRPHFALEVTDDHNYLAVWQDHHDWHNYYHYTPFETLDEALTYLSDGAFPKDDSWTEPLIAVGIVKLDADPTNCWMTLQEKYEIARTIHPLTGLGEEKKLADNTRDEPLTASLHKSR